MKNNYKVQFLTNPMLNDELKKIIRKGGSKNNSS
jgi:hypothetical protein